MIKLKKMVFNSFQVNTYILHDDTSECVIIDPANHDEEEHRALEAMLSQHELNPVLIVNTHCHVDHVPGIHFLKKRFGIPFMAHEEETPILENAPLMGELFGFNIAPLEGIDQYIADDEMIRFGNAQIRAMHVPGHSRGSLAFYAENEAFAVTGDALFAAGIGRTDLPGGDYDTLMESIKKKLFTLPPKTEIWPGHGGSSTIAKERESNPFFQ